MTRASTSTSKSASPPPSPEPPDPAEFQAAFLEEDRRERLRIGKLGCWLVILLMPVGWLLDLAVTSDPTHSLFLGLRLGCSLLTGGLLALHSTKWGARKVRWLGPPIALLPVLAISVMIANHGGIHSSYYAGLNLVLIAVNVVARWTIAESLAISASTLVLYGIACVVGTPAGEFRLPELFNNLYFMVLTAVIVVAGNGLYNRLRLREFTFRFELDRNQRLIEESNRKLRELDELKSRFFANISHELRTPLTLLLAPLDSLRARGASASSAEIQTELHRMQVNGLRLLKLINDLLDLVRLDSGGMALRRQRVDVDGLVRGIVASAASLAQDRRLNLRADVAEGTGVVMADHDKIEKILLNLIINAIKFTAAGGTVDCRARREGERLLLEVRDSGMGIQPEQLPYVFDRFWQADTSARRKHQGAGIGLALVKELVEVQEGTVSVSSVVNQGTTFTVSLPWIRPETVPTTSNESTASPNREETEAQEPQDRWLVELYRRAELFPALASLKETVRTDEAPVGDSRPALLIADDEPDMLQFLRTQLSPHFRVIEAVDGQQAIDRAAQYRPEAVLCDMMMPEKDGLQVCRELRERMTTRHIPIVLLTARADEATKLAGLEAGANDFLTKPFSGVELHLRLGNLVESHKLQRQLVRQKQILESTLEELKETEMQLVQSEKLASLGRFSAGIIHEINNPLNYAKTGLFALRKMGRRIAEADQADYNDILADVENGLTRVAGIISELRGFTHPDQNRIDDVPVSDAVESALRFLAAELGDRVDVVRQIPEGMTVRANRNRLIQVLLNLLENAIDATALKSFPEGSHAEILISGVERDQVGELHVRDNGPGISDDIRGKIFEPFFTTKDVGEGTGLGLSICHRLVSEMEGRIRVESKLGEGSEFTLEFPRGV